jgi:hypothetical protein
MNNASEFPTDVVKDRKNSDKKTKQNEMIKDINGDLVPAGKTSGL